MPNADVIGVALLAFYNKEKVEDIIVKSSIAEDDVLPITYLFRSEKQLPKIEKKALQLCKGNILDVGAGSGCHSAILQKNNKQVYAIDTSQGAVDVMLLRGLSAENINFFDVTTPYDTLLFLMNGVGIAGTIAELPKFLNHAKSLLKPDGQILLDSSDIKYMFEEEDGSVWMDLNTNYYGEVSYQMQYKNLITPSFNWLFVDFNQLKEVAEQCGLACELLTKGSHHDYLAKLTLK
jgi:SAM-dependent methyltransferase